MCSLCGYLVAAWTMAISFTSSLSFSFGKIGLKASLAQLAMAL